MNRNRLPQNHNSPKKSKKLNDKIAPHHMLIIDLLKTIAKSTKDQQTTVHGQAVIEKVGQPAVVTMYASYPNGNFMCWFNDGQFFRVYSLVNKSMKHVLKIPADQVQLLQEELTKLKGILGQ